MMKRVEIESPYKPSSASKEARAKELQRNLRYGRACMADSLRRGEAPLASHLLYTQEGILDDTIAYQRILGMEAGKAWSRFAQLVVVYADLGISSGMQWGIDRADERGTPVEYRSLGGEWAELEGDV
jgi:hypothetical protein